MTLTKYQLFRKMERLFETEIPEVLTRLCQIFGRLLQHKVAFDLDLDILLRLLRSEDQTVQASAFWCLNCGVIEQKFNLSIVADHLAELCQAESFAFGVSVESAHALLAC
jgi:hypothetical protein